MILLVFVTALLLLEAAAATAASAAGFANCGNEELSSCWTSSRLFKFGTAEFAPPFCIEFWLWLLCKLVAELTPSEFTPFATFAFPIEPRFRPAKLLVNKLSVELVLDAFPKLLAKLLPIGFGVGCE